MSYAATATGRITRAEVPLGFNLAPLLDQFLTHLRDYRDCSERTVEAYRKDGEAFVEFLRSEGVATVETIQRHHAHRFAARLSHLAPATIRRKVYALRSWFGYLVDVGLVEANPMASVELPKRRPNPPKVPTKCQCNALLSVCETPTQKLIIALLLLAGLRKSELLGLNIEDVSAAHDQIRVEGKGRKERVVPLCAFAQQAVQRYLAQRTASGAALVVGQGGNRLASTGLYRIFRRIIRRAGLDGSDITPHSLRHAFATYLIREGVDIATVSELMGHSNISTTSIYLHSDTSTKQAAVQRLPWAGKEQ